MKYAKDMHKRYDRAQSLHGPHLSSLLLVSIVAVGLFVALTTFHHSGFLKVQANIPGYKQNFSTIVTPKIINDFTNPLPSIQKFYDTYQSTMSHFQNQLVVFDVGSGDQIYRYPTNAFSPFTAGTTPFLTNNTVQFDPPNANSASYTTTTLSSADSYQGLPSYKVWVNGASGREVVASNLYANGQGIDLRANPLMSWNWQKTGGSTMIIQFVLRDKVTNQKTYIGYYAGAAPANGSPTAWAQFYLGSMPTSWRHEQVNLYQDLITDRREMSFTDHSVEQNDWEIVGVALTPYDGVSGLYNNVIASQSNGVEWARDTMGQSYAQNQTYVSQSGDIYPQELTYAELRNIFTVFRQEGQRRGLNVKIFDGVEAAYEFSSQDWKYAMHPEVVYTPGNDANSSFPQINFEGVLNADTYGYATYPGGVPAGTKVRDFMASQIGAYVKDMGLDGIYGTNDFGVWNQWTPIAGNGYDPTHAANFLSFLQNLKSQMGVGKLLMWADTYLPVSVNHDDFSIPDAAYGYMDYIQMSTFFQNSNGSPVTARWIYQQIQKYPQDFPPGLTDSLDSMVTSEIALKSTHPNLKLLWTSYYDDPWYSAGYQNNTSLSGWDTYKSYGSGLDGLMLYANNYNASHGSALDEGLVPENWQDGLVNDIDGLSAQKYVFSGNWAAGSGNGDKPGEVTISGDWLLRNTANTGSPDVSFKYGDVVSTDVPLMCDWNGTGVKTPGVFRNGVWYIRNANTTGNADVSFSYGDPGDIPVCGDWDGNGTQTPGVFRNGVWYLRNSNTSGIADVVVHYGNASGDIPIVGKWLGGKTDTIGLVRGNTWYLSNSNTSGATDTSFNFGNVGDKPVVGDWDGNGTDTPGVVRSDTWYVKNSNTSGLADATFTLLPN